MAEKDDVYGLEFQADSSELKAAEKALDGIEKKAESAEDAVNKLGAQTEKYGSQAKNFGSALGSVFKNIGSKIATSFKSIGEFFKHPIQTIKSGLVEALNKAKKSTDETGSAAKKMGSDFEESGDKGEKGVSKIFSAIKLVAFIMLVKKATQAVVGFVKDSINAFGSLQTSGTQLEAILGSNATAASEWVEKYAKAVNRSKTEVTSFLAQSAAMFNSLGINKNAITELSESTTALAYDLGAFFKISDDDAFSALTSAIQGNAEAITAYGVRLDDITLKRTAASMGIYKEISELDDATAAQVRYQAILNQTKNAQLGTFKATEDYAGGIKNIKSLVQDFIADAGKKFAPALGKMFNKVLELWPKIEPALMSLVDLLVNGLSDAAPVIAELAEQLIPVLADTIGAVFKAIKPLIPIILDLIKKLLPPISALINSFIKTLLPPLVNIIEILIPPLIDIINQILPPMTAFIEMLVPPIMQLVQSLLPPLFDIISVLIPPLIEIVQAILPPILDIIETLLPPLMDIINAVLPIIQSVLEAIMPLFTKLVKALMPVFKTLLKAIEPVLKAIAPVVEAIGAALEIIVDAISWVVNAVIDAGTWVLELLGFDVGKDASAGVSGAITTGAIPGNASGTDYFPGGWTRINELGGEIAYLPRGSQIIPADKSQDLIDGYKLQSKPANVSKYEVNISINVQGNADDYTLLRLKETAQKAVEDALAAVRLREYSERFVQG